MGHKYVIAGQPAVTVTQEYVFMKLSMHQNICCLPRVKVIQEESNITL